jgi:hypothetical protein
VQGLHNLTRKFKFSTLQVSSPSNTLRIHFNFFLIFNRRFYVLQSRIWLLYLLFLASRRSSSRRYIISLDFHRPPSTHSRPYPFTNYLLRYPRLPYLLISHYINISSCQLFVRTFVSFVCKQISDPLGFCSFL